MCFNRFKRKFRYTLFLISLVTLISLLLLSSRKTKSQKFSHVNINFPLGKKILRFKPINREFNQSSFPLPDSKIIQKSSKHNLSSNYSPPISHTLAIHYDIADEFISLRRIDEKFKGNLNIYAWTELYSGFIEILRGVPGFPYNPMKKDYISKLSLSQEHTPSYGVRIFGYIFVPKTGKYIFSINSAHHSEIWLSSNHEPMQARKIAYVGSFSDFEYFPRQVENENIFQFTSQISDDIFLIESTLYYIEILHACDPNQLESIDFKTICYLQLFWRGKDIQDKEIANSFKDFRIINEDYLILHHYYLDDKLESKPFSSYSLSTLHQFKYISSSAAPDKRLEMLNFPIISNEIKEIFPVCSLPHVNTYPHDVIDFQGLLEVRELMMFPDDGSDYYIDQRYSTPLLRGKESRSLISTIERQIKNALPNLEMYEIYNIERTWYNYSNGNRYLFEAKIKLSYQSTQFYRLSEYFYMPPDSEELCSLSDIKWDKTTFVYIALPVKNLGYWTRHMIENLELIQDRIADDKWGLIVADYESKDIDVLALLAQSSIKNWWYLKLKGNFMRSHGINSMLNLVHSDKNAILVTCDLQLNIPYNYFDIIRKHTIRGKTASAPILLRLYPGRYFDNPLGYWEDLGYGHISLYIDDWFRISGMNTDDFGGHWGGEDWELLDRILSFGYELQRFRIYDFYHYYHSRVGTWDSHKGLGTKFFC